MSWQLRERIAVYNVTCLFCSYLLISQQNGSPSWRYFCSHLLCLLYPKEYLACEYLRLRVRNAKVKSYFLPYLRSISAKRKKARLPTPTTQYQKELYGYLDMDMKNMVTEKERFNYITYLIELIESLDVWLTVCVSGYCFKKQSLWQPISLLSRCAF